MDLEFWNALFLDFSAVAGLLTFATVYHFPP